jgi:glycosyltransferase involved in cell wall biosynthesis
MALNDTVAGRDIVIVGQQAWDVEIGSNNKNIALELSKLNRVLYVNPALDRITLFNGKNNPKVEKRIAIIKGKEKGIVPIKDNLWNVYPDRMVESINWLKSRSLFNVLNKANNRKFARSIMDAIATLGFKNIILFNDNDMFRSYYLKELLKPDISIYYSRDYMLAVDYWKFHGEKLEPALIAKSDICMANSTYLADYCKKYNPVSYYVGQGCDLGMFTNLADSSVPADMASFARPVIGYVGALQKLRLDIDLLAYIAEQRPQWSIALAGPEDDEFKKSRLHEIKNIHFLGSKQPLELPKYINAFDVCLNPQVVNQVTIGNYPRKIDEYLAMGKPVVATVTEAMSIFAGHTYLAVTPKDYVVLIEKALAEDNPVLQSQRKEFAASHSWTNNVKEIYKGINQFVLQRKNGGSR